MADGLLLSLGGNALIRPGEEGDIPQQVGRARETFRSLARLVARHSRALLVHGIARVRWATCSSASSATR